MKPHVRFLYRLMYDAPKEAKADLGGAKDPFAVKIVGLSMMCYTKSNSDKTCFGERQLSGRMGK